MIFLDKDKREERRITPYHAIAIYKGQLDRLDEWINVDNVFARANEFYRNSSHGIEMKRLLVAHDVSVC